MSPEQRAAVGRERCKHGYLIAGDELARACHEGENVAALCARRPIWDYADVFGGPWTVGTEARSDGAPAIRSGAFTIVTLGDYFDGGGPIEDRLQFICDAVNATMGWDT